jgi:phosphoenolpyruvate synthase/pyruvate phosphate dikinase
MADETATRTRASKEEVQQRWQEMAQLVESGTPSGKAAEEIAEKYGVKAGTLKVQWGKWAKANGYGHLVRGGGGEGGSRAAAVETNYRRVSRGGVSIPDDDIDIQSLIARRQEALKVKIASLEKELCKKRDEAERINKALEALGYDPEADGEGSED